MTTSSVEQNITIVQRFCKAGNEGLSGDRCATTAHALAATTSTGGLAPTRRAMFNTKFRMALIFCLMLTALV
jgi:hypothetical protein